MFFYFLISLFFCFATITHSSANTQKNHEKEADQKEDRFYHTASISSLNKITTERSKTSVSIQKPARFGNLLITIKGCWVGNTASLNTEEARAYVIIWENKSREMPVKIFEGWLWSKNPSVSVVEHPIYDVALLDCKEEQ